MSTDDVLLGLGLVLVLAVGAEFAARLARLPAIVVLLPVGFVAGILTDDVQPDRLLGDLFQPFVSIAVGIILFEAGLRLTFAGVAPDARRLVIRLVVIGVLVSWLGVTAAVALLFDGFDASVAWLIGAILVVSGPTVVLPLLAYIRPTRPVRSLLTWEGVLVDPVGALLGVIVLNGATSAWHPGQWLLSVAVGLAVAAVAAGMLWLMLGETQTLVQLLVGVLFILIAASVSPADVGDVLPEALILVAVMALVVLPVAVALATAGSQLTARERAFMGWMAPRGIVAGATASAFGLELAEQGVAGAEQVLPIVFVVIFGTVVLYGLTGAPVARRLGIAGAGGPVALSVGGHQWARAMGAALQQAGVGVRLWTGDGDEQAAARAAGLEAERGRMMVDSVSRETELEEVTDALVLSPSDDFNALAAAELRIELGHEHVHRLAPETERAALAPSPREDGLLVTFAEMTRMYADGSRLVVDTDRSGGRFTVYFEDPDGPRTPASGRDAAGPADASSRGTSGGP